jgi:hypothetical protein
MEPEVGWLLDDSRLCLGFTCGSLGFVTYTDPNAIRFARAQDAENMKKALAMRESYMVRNVKPVEHQWG